jgi:hypothetical protein
VADGVRGVLGEVQDDGYNIMRGLGEWWSFFVIEDAFDSLKVGQC